MVSRIRKIIQILYLKRLIKRGLKVGSNFDIEKDVNIDAGFPWLISIGNNVTLASGVYILAHDASTKYHLGKSKVGGVKIGNNVFIGAKSIILPNVHIGDNVVIGANSCVAHNVDSGSVVAGNPAILIMTMEEFLNKNSNRMAVSQIYDESYTLDGGITKGKKEKMIAELLNVNKIGFVE